MKKLPHQLVEAFKSTLEVAAGADLLVHVVDGSAADPTAHMNAVAQVLSDIDASEVPQLIVFNKADLGGGDVERLVASNPGSVGVSAFSGEGTEDVLLAIGDRLRALSTVYELFIPWARGDALASVHREGQVVVEITEEDGMRLRARLEEASASRLRPFIVATNPDPEEVS